MQSKIHENYVQMSTTGMIIRQMQLGDRIDDLVSQVQKLTRDQLEDHAADILTMSICLNYPEVTCALITKGVRSGFALDAAVYRGNLKLVHQLLQSGVHPSQSAEKIALSLNAFDIVNAIVTKRDENVWFEFRPEF